MILFYILESTEETTTEENNLVENDDLDTRNNKLANYNFTLHNNSTAETDNFNLLNMNIRCKRRCSNSSAVSNNDSNSDDKTNFRKSRKKKKSKCEIIRW